MLATQFDCNGSLPTPEKAPVVLLFTLALLSRSEALFKVPYLSFRFASLNQKDVGACYGQNV